MAVQRAKNILIWLFKPFYPQKRRYWRVVFFCFLAASTFWLLNALNKRYTTRISFPIRLVYDETKLIPVRPLPEEVTIDVTGRGWKLLPQALRLNPSEAEIPVRNLPYTNYILGPALRPHLSNVLDGLQLNFVVNDTLYFYFNHRIKRTLPVALDTTQTLTDANYAVAPPVKITPATITFVGASSVLDTLPNPYLVKLPPSRLTGPYKGKAPIVFNPAQEELIQTNVQEVEIAFDVAPLVQERKQTLPTLLNFPKGTSLSLNPVNIDITYKFIKGQGKLIDRNQFKVALDFTRFNPADSTIEPTLLHKPELVKKVSLKPAKVKINLNP